MVIRFQMSEETVDTGWGALLRPAWLPAVAVLVGGVLLPSMNVLMLATVLPSVVDNLGGARLMSGTTTPLLASSIAGPGPPRAMACVVGRGSVPEGLGARGCALLAGAWRLAIVVGPLVGGLFARYGD